MGDQRNHDFITEGLTFKLLEQATALGVFAENSIGTKDTDAHKLGHESGLESLLIAEEGIFGTEVLVLEDCGGRTDILDIVSPISHHFLDALAPTGILSWRVVRPNSIQNNSSKRTLGMINEGKNAMDTNGDLGLIGRVAAVDSSLLESRGEHHHDDNWRGEKKAS